MHVSAQNWGAVDVKGLEWNIFNIYDSIVRWAVPVFLMISGTLFLPKQISFKKLFYKNIFRLVIAFFSWSFFYAMAIPYLYHQPYSIKGIISCIFAGNYHMWFIPMLIGVYMSIPILQMILKDSRITRYFLVLWFCFWIFIPFCNSLATDFIGGLIAGGINAGCQLLIKSKASIAIGYVGYFVWGYFLSITDFSVRQRKIIYALGFVGFLSTILLSAWLSWKNGVPSSYYDNSTLNVFLEATGLFVWFRYRNYKREKNKKIICFLSKYSFGAYLVHAILINCVEVLGWTTLSFHPIFSVPVITIVVSLLSFLISVVLNKIPVIQKCVS